MKTKLKITLTAVTFLFIFYSSNVFAQEFDYMNGLLDDEELIIKNTLPIEVYDNDLTTSIQYDKEFDAQINFKYKTHITGMYINRFTQPDKSIYFYFDNGQVHELSFEKSINDYINLDYENVVSIRIIKTISSDLVREIDFFGTYDDTLIIDDVNLIEVENLNYEIYHNKIVLTYDIPTNENYANTKILVDGKLHGMDITGYYEITGLQPNTQYEIKVLTENNNGILSSGLSNTIRTKEEPVTNEHLITPVKNINIQSKNESLLLTWNHPYHSHLLGYNIYLNGAKVNSNPVKNSSYEIIGLTNGQEYSIRITTVLEDGTEGNFSNSIIGIPKLDYVPTIKLTYTLNDLVNSIAEWFGSLWSLLAFSVAIPLSFLIGNRVKNLFLT